MPRNILLPPSSRQAAVALKHKIRQKCLETQSDNDNEYPFVVDVFARAARKYSRDDYTKDNGGLLGELVPHGHCRDAVLDRACFEVPLGEIAGPLESADGYSCTNALIVPSWMEAIPNSCRAKNMDWGKSYQPNKKDKSIFFNYNAIKSCFGWAPFLPVASWPSFRPTWPML